MTIRVLGDPPTVRALRLAGIDGAIAPKGGEAAALERELSLKDLGVLLITEPVASAIRQKVNAAKVSLHFPLVLEIPAVGAPSIPMDDVVTVVAKMLRIGS